ncbi:Cof-type HAD-IIB family hydrolase [Olsenella profusa]|uniref:Cof-type HAD-IIB family hydrolase n=1 Tax=Olsenella profusa TaxID=138595 RepID=A0ABS2F2M4_9ACTN|nr:Cof-type HAD-IIB family hydrolase [Olsenella profusa]MBM6775078.1 Cof-type HAD-IIB family hydrolase [Olsenella profusa]
MIRLIASDLDETLLDDTHHVPERVRRAVAAARERGARFVPATGRPFGSVDVTLSELGLLGTPGEYVLSFNGGVITENAERRPLTSCSLPRDRAEALYEFGVAHELCMHVNTLDPVYLYHYVPEERAYIEGRMNIVETHEPTLDFLYAAGHVVVKLIYMSLDMGYLRHVRDELDAAGLTRGLDVYYSGNRYLECNAPGVNKGAGLMELARRLGVAREEVMAIGDNSNDVSMIREAGVGVAVANATEEAKAAADYVCQADNNAGGVAEAIEKFVLEA